MRLSSVDLEHAASLHLGQLVIHFSRMESDIAKLLLAWSDECGDAPSSSQIESASFKDKLDMLEAALSIKYRHVEHRLTAWLSWIGQANSLRLRRNALIHGWWGADEQRQVIVNVVGLAGSQNRTTYAYSLQELSDEVNELTSLITWLRTYSVIWREERRAP